jgi:hypothetical protein
VRTRVPSTALFVVVLLFLSGFLAGCGANDQSGSGGGEAQNADQAQSGGDTQRGGGGQGGGKATSQGAPQMKVALGTIESVQPDKRMIVLKPSTEIQGGEQMTFSVRKSAEITVNDQAAEISDIEAGQQAQIQYVTRGEENRASAVQIVGGG